MRTTSRQHMPNHINNNTCNNKAYHKMSSHVPVAAVGSDVRYR